MDVKGLVAEVGVLASLPQAVMQINRLLDDPDSSDTDVAAAIGNDPALAIRVLRIANSPLYGLSTQVDSIARAVTLLGRNKIRDLTMAAAITELFSGVTNDLVSMRNFWLHSLYCALAAEYLAAARGRRGGEPLFLAGLLHDIGELVIFHSLPEEAAAVLLESAEESEEREIFRVERARLGFDHAAVGAELARQWQLPSLLFECIAFHHEPARAEKYPLAVALVHVANSAACLAELDSTDPTEAPPIAADAWHTTGLEPVVLVPCVAAVREQVGELQSLFLPA